MALLIFVINNLTGCLINKFFNYYWNFYAQTNLKSPKIFLKSPNPSQAIQPQIRLSLCPIKIFIEYNRFLTRTWRPWTNKSTKSSSLLVPPRPIIIGKEGHPLHPSITHCTLPIRGDLGRELAHLIKLHKRTTTSDFSWSSDRKFRSRAQRSRLIKRTTIPSSTFQESFVNRHCTYFRLTSTAGLINRIRERRILPAHTKSTSSFLKTTYTKDQTKCLLSFMKHSSNGYPKRLPI